MTVFGISVMRDEADICCATVKQMLRQVDEVIVLDHDSVDGTREILKSLPIHVIDDDDEGHWQSRKMTTLAHQARAAGADWVIPFDADEFWYSPVAPRIGDLLGETAPQWLTVSAAIYNHVPTSIDGNRDPFQRIGWRQRDPLPLVKVVCRTHPELVIHDGNHGADYPGGTTRLDGRLVVRHFPYRSPEQMVRKVRNGAGALALTGLPEDTGRHWRDYGALLEARGPEVIHDIFREHFYSDDPDTDPNLIYDPVTSLQ